MSRSIVRWEDNINMALQEVGGGCGESMELAQDRERWRALESMVRNLRVPKMRRISWLGAEPVSFSRRTLLHGVSKYTGTSKGKYFLRAVFKPKDVHFLFSELYYSFLMLARVSKNLVFWGVWADRYMRQKAYDEVHFLCYARLVNVMWGLWLYDCQ